MNAYAKEVKARGVKNLMPVAEAQRVRPSLLLVAPNPDLYRRQHNALLFQIEPVIAIDAAKSTDEATCALDDSGRRDPDFLAARIKSAVADNSCRSGHCGAERAWQDPGRRRASEKSA